MTALTIGGGGGGVERVSEQAREIQVQVMHNEHVSNGNPLYDCVMLAMMKHTSEAKLGLPKFHG